MSFDKKVEEDDDDELAVIEAILDKEEEPEGLFF
jgi:hypothetical protein